MSNFTPEFVQAVEILERAGFGTRKWTRQPTRPLLVSLAKELDDSARSRETIHIKDRATRKAEKIRITHERAQAGKAWQTVARKLGHQEVQGKFFWADRRYSKKGQVVGCLLCGVHDHGFEECSHFRERFNETHGQDYTESVFPRTINIKRRDQNQDQDQNQDYASTSN
jgi:hypothetical protein